MADSSDANDRQSLRVKSNKAIRKAVTKAAKRRPRTRLRPVHPKWKRSLNPLLERSPYSGVNKDEARWRRHLKRKTKTNKIENMKEDYIQGKMDSRFKEAMLVKRRRQVMREATESLKNRDDHVVKLVNDQTRRQDMLEREECFSEYQKRMEELKDEEALTCRRELLESRRRRRISEGMSPLSPATANLHGTPTKLSVRRETIERILQEHNPHMAQPRKLEGLLRKWKGKEAQLLQNIREKYGIEPPPKKSTTPKKEPKRPLVHPPFGSAEGRHKSKSILEERRKKMSSRRMGQWRSSNSPPVRRKTRKAATPTRAQLSASKHAKPTPSTKEAQAATKHNKGKKPHPAVAAKSNANESTGAKPVTKSKTRPEKKETAEAPLKLTTDFSEFAVIAKTSARAPVSSPATDTTDIAATIRARILQRQHTLSMEPPSPELTSQKDLRDEEDAAETDDEEKPETTMPNQEDQEDLINARRQSLERRDLEKRMELEKLESSTPKEEEEEREEQWIGEEESKEDDETLVQSTEGANKLAAAMAAVQAALADDGYDDFDVTTPVAEESEDDADRVDMGAMGSGFEMKEEGPLPCSDTQNAKIIGTWTYKEVDEAFKTMRVFKDYTFTYREDRLPSKMGAAEQTWMRRKGHWGSSVQNKVIQLVFSFTEVLKGHIVNGAHTEDGPAAAMEEDWIVTFSKLQAEWEKEWENEDSSNNTDDIAERLQAMRVDLQENESESGEEDEAIEGEAQPPMVPNVANEEEDAGEEEDSGEEDEEEFEEEEDEEEEQESAAEEYDDDELEEDDEEDEEDEEEDEDEENGEEASLEDQLVGTWLRQQDSQFENIQILADGRCSHRRERDITNEAGEESREWSLDQGTWTVDEEDDSLCFVFTKCTKGVQAADGSNVDETQDMVKSRDWSIQLKTGLFQNWEKEEEY